MNQFTYRPFYRRNLPHIQPEGAALFVTFRLAGSLPENVKTRNKGHKQVAKEEEDYFIRQWDDVLDSMQRSPKYLANHRIANLVAESMHYRDNKFYDLEAFCIMPNHVHIIFTPLKAGDTYYSLSQILHSLKRHTARQANLILKREGAFWQHESYDHYIRNDREFIRIVNYVLQNPVKAGLVDEWQDWEWTYYKHM